ncbi:hypothetical protein GWK47_007830 [Chionoecetes opilio]|uniref:HAT C-terminal dimerisation domain-containing protein n=1 Tax=Chionoecetes opilio TaxID=41210 RepID=A0A8J5C9E6_CHIOP|nr:hypothetical protein GWK47_007830 [Chionoecetes opilio]
MDLLNTSICQYSCLCRRTKIRIFKSLVIPVLLYGCGGDQGQDHQGAKGHHQAQGEGAAAASAWPARSAGTRGHVEARLFNKLFARGPANQQQDVREVLRNSMEEWVPSKGELAWSLFPYQHREVWVDLFIRYNTPLLSSAAVERLFSTAGDVLRAKRSSLEEVNFEELVFLKGNMDLLEEKMGQEDVEEEEEDL